jgi:hypothetical protein
MNAEAYAFSMRLVQDSIQSARRCLETYEATPKHDLNRLRDLQAARGWVSCARTNIGFAEAELSTAPRTLKPLRARAVKGARS